MPIFGLSYVNRDHNSTLHLYNCLRNQSPLNINNNRLRNFQCRNLQYDLKSIKYLNSRYLLNKIIKCFFNNTNYYSNFNKPYNKSLPQCNKISSIIKFQFLNSCPNSMFNLNKSLLFKHFRCK